MRSQTSNDQAAGRSGLELPSQGPINSLLQDGLRVAWRTKLSEPKQRRGRSKTITEPEQTRVRSEHELREEAAWKEVEQTGKPVVFDGQLLMPDGMSLSKAIEFLPDGVREQARKNWEYTSVEIFRILLRGARGQIREKIGEQGHLEKHDASPEVAKTALDESVVREQLGWPEVPLEELIKRYGGKIDSAHEQTAKSMSTEQLVTDDSAKRTLPTDSRPSEFDKLPIEMLIAKAESSAKKQALLWNVDHHRLMLKRIDQLWEYLNDEEQQLILDLLTRRIRRAEVDQVDEIIRGCEWVRMIEDRKST